jgi:hypothetical protein
MWVYTNIEMVILYQYTIKCNTHGVQQTDYRATPPTVCPLNAADSVDLNEIYIVNSFEQSARVEADDGRLSVAPAVIPQYTTQYHCGCADDFSGGTISNGPQFHLVNDGSGVRTMNFNFVTPVYILGGDIVIGGAGLNDWATLGIFAPPTPVTADPSGVGNCNLVNIGVGNLIVPAAGGNTGAYNISPTSGMNSNVDNQDPFFVSQCVPVPALDTDGTTGIGYWNWNDITGEIVPSAPGQGMYNLFDVQVNLANYVNRCMCWNPTGVYTRAFDVVQKGKQILPHWTWITAIYRDGSHAVDDEPLICAWNIRGGRRRTCPLFGDIYS